MKSLFLGCLLSFMHVGLMLNPTVAKASNEVGYDVDEEFRAYCDKVLSRLERSRASASDAIMRGHFAEAFSVLQSGLQQGRQSYGDINPIAFNLIAHAATVGSTLQGTLTNDVKSVKAATIVLEGFYDLIFDTAYNLDYVYYRCSSFRRGCRHSQTLEFERNVLTMVRNMLSLTNSSLLVTRQGQVFPLGPASTYLKTSEVVTLAAYAELRNMVTSRAYSCEILDLKDISTDLRSFNSMTTDERVKRDKVNQTYSDISNIVYSLQYPNCRY